MNTGSHDEQVVIAGIQRVGQQSARIADALERIAAAQEVQALIAVSEMPGGTLDVGAFSKARSRLNEGAKR